MAYKIKEIKEDPKQSIIEKSGITVEFTINDLEVNIASAKKKVIELESKKSVDSATMRNIENTHPHIASMSMEDLAAAFLYRESMGRVTASEELIAKFNEAIEADSKTLEEVIKETGIEI